MTRQYPDQDTPARFLARVASAARAASFKSASRQMSTAPWHEAPTTIPGPSETLIEEVCGGIAIARIDRERRRVERSRSTHISHSVILVVAKSFTSEQQGYP